MAFGIELGNTRQPDVVVVGQIEQSSIQIQKHRIDLRPVEHVRYHTGALRFDLHTHSHHSDGTLSPTALVQHAAAHGVDLLALTDHDSVAGCDEAQTACEQSGVRFVAGIELTCGWRGQTLHVLGLGLGAQAPALQAQIKQVLQRRRSRISEIGERLERRGRIAVRALVDELLSADAVPTRMHLARALVHAGHAATTKEAFDRWLGRGQPAHVPVEWPSLEETLSCLQQATATVVLAHPHRYKLSAGTLRQLAAQFKDGGGHGLEISVGGMSPNDLDRLATLARRYGLAASGGSDFHDPAVPWNPPGRFAKLPADLELIAARFAAPDAPSQAAAP